MASPVEDRTGSSMAPDAEMAARRAARDDFVGDLRELSKDVAMIRNTVAKIAGIVGSQTGGPAWHLRSDIASTVKQKGVITIVFALFGAALLLLSLIFGIEALHEWLKSRYGSLPAFIILWSAWTVLSIVFLCVALLLSKRGSRASTGGGRTCSPPARMAK